jgi:hypothetical protein
MIRMHAAMRSGFRGWFVTYRQEFVQPADERETTMRKTIVGGVAVNPYTKPLRSGSHLLWRPRSRDGCAARTRNPKSGLMTQ